MDNQNTFVQPPLPCSNPATGDGDPDEKKKLERKTEAIHTGLILKDLYQNMVIPVT